MARTASTFFSAYLVGNIDEYDGPDEIDVPEDIADYTENTRVHSVKEITGWGCRYSAPGYMDCTPWTVYGTALEALEGLLEGYDEDEDIEQVKNAIDIDGLFREGHLTEADKPKLIELGLLEEEIEETRSNGLWENDLIQFARLIAELEAEGMFQTHVLRALENAMDLELDALAELIDRAQQVWDKAKADLPK